MIMFKGQRPAPHTREEILCVHRLGIPATLNLTFLSTNLIENVMRNWREHPGNIKRWNVKTDMVERWAASGLLWAEIGFRRIRHHEDLPNLREALARSPAASTSAKGDIPVASLDGGLFWATGMSPFYILDRRRIQPHSISSNTFNTNSRPAVGSERPALPIMFS